MAKEVLSICNDSKCVGSITVDDLPIYEISNPLFLSDTFVFCRKHYERSLSQSFDLDLYIKVNFLGKIEEIGNDFSKRFHYEHFNLLCSRFDVREATSFHKALFSSISDTIWLKGVEI